LSYVLQATGHPLGESADAAARLAELRTLVGLVVPVTPVVQLMQAKI
jgi:hypothetical protein